MTATVVMMLVEDGLVGLTRPVQEYLPLFVGEDKDLVCVHHLLTHTSGISDEQTAAYITGNWDVDVPVPEGVNPVTHKQRVLGASAPLWKKPGEEMLYSNGNYLMLGQIVRAAAGCRLADFARDRIFSPLGMHDTHYVPPDKARARVPRGPANWTFNAGPFSALMLAAGGAHATAMDTAVFGQTFLNGGAYGDARILSRSTVEEMTRNQIPGIGTTFPFTGEHHAEASWGYGWIVASDEKWAGFPAFPKGTFCHSGGSGTVLWADPSNDLVAVFLSIAQFIQAEGSQSAELIWCADLFAKAVYSVLD